MNPQRILDWCCLQHYRTSFSSLCVLFCLEMTAAKNHSQCWTIDLLSRFSVPIPLTMEIQTKSKGTKICQYSVDDFRFWLNISQLLKSLLKHCLLFISIIKMYVVKLYLINCSYCIITAIHQYMESGLSPCWKTGWAVAVEQKFCLYGYTEVSQPVWLRV